MSTTVRVATPIQVGTTPVPVGSAIFPVLTVASVLVQAHDGYDGSDRVVITFTTPHGCSNAGTDKVTFWGVGTNTWLNQLTVSTYTVVSTTAISFTSTADSGFINGADTGSAIVTPVQRFRVVRLEADQFNTGNVFVGDGTVSAGSLSPATIGRYAALLSSTGQIAFELAGEGIDICLLWVLASVAAQYVQVSLVY